MDLNDVADLSLIPNDLLRAVYAECLRIKHEDARAVAVKQLSSEILGAVRSKYADASVSTVSFPILGTVRVQVDTYGETRTRKAFAITATADTHPDSIVYGMIFMRIENGEWVISTVPFGSTAGGSNLAFSGLRDFMDDVAKGVVDRYTPTPAFDRRTLDAETVRAKIAEAGEDAAAEYFGVSVYRLRKIVD